MSDTGVLVILSIVALAGFGVTRLSPALAHSRHVVVVVAVTVIAGAIMLMLSVLSHPPLVEASGVLHD
jgi:hypothetical protein